MLERRPGLIGPDERRRDGTGGCRSIEDLDILGIRDRLVGKKSVLCALEHKAGKVPHDGLCLDGKVSKHSIGAPATQKADGVAVDMRTKKCHGTCSSQGTGADITGKEAKSGPQSGDRKAEGGGDVAGVDKTKHTIRAVVSTQGSVGRGIVLAKVLDAAADRDNRAHVRISTPGEADDLPTNGILLISELEGNECSRD